MTLWKGKKAQVIKGDFQNAQIKPLLKQTSWSKLFDAYMPALRKSIRYVLS